MNDQPEDLHILQSNNSTPAFICAPHTNYQDAYEAVGHPDPHPTWIQSSDNSCPPPVFDPAFGLHTVMSPVPTKTIHYLPNNDQLEDSDLLVPSPMVSPIDLEKFLPGISVQNELDVIVNNPVPSTSSTNTAQLSLPAPSLLQPTKPDPRKESCARTYHRQPIKKQNKTFLHPNPIQVRAKKNQKVCPTRRKVKSLLTKSTQSWVSKMDQSTQTILDTESSFNNEDFGKVHTILKKLDNTNPLYVSPPALAFQVIQQRQQLLQAFNIFHAAINKMEAITTFTFFHRPPFPPYRQR